MVPLKYLSNFWWTLEMSFIKYEINLDLNSSRKCIIVASNTDKVATFSITDTKPYVPVVFLYQFKVKQNCFSNENLVFKDKQG